MTRRAVFWDRDGTVAEAISRPELDKKITAPFSLKEIRFTPKVTYAMSVFHLKGFLNILITNQPDVAYGYLTEETWTAIHKRIIGQLPLDDVFICRHPRGHDCFLRKPKPGMLIAASENHSIDLASSFMIGDTNNDTLAGKAAGCQTIILDKPYNQGVAADLRVQNITEAMAFILDGLKVKA